MLDRISAPAFKTINKIDVIKANRSKLKNGIDFFSLAAGSQEISKIEFIFKAGMYQQPAALIASTTNTLIETGTKSYSANEISDGVDFYGSFLELQVEQDFATVTLYSLNKYLDESLKFVEEILKCPTFPEDEFRIHMNNKKQKHLINSQKVSVLARRKFSELLFGAKHPYGIDVTEKDFERINIDELKQFFNKHYTSTNCTVIASGNLPSNIEDTLNRFFGNDAWGQSKEQIVSPVIAPDTTSTLKHFFIAAHLFRHGFAQCFSKFNDSHSVFCVRFKNKNKNQVS